jgi:hypothetical protein
MRILSFLFKSAIFLIIVGTLSYFIGRELLLFSGISQVRNATVQMRQASQNLSQYVAECQKRGAVDLSVDVIERIQLRFTDSRNYRIEVLCQHLSLDPIVVSEHTLPLYVAKVPGSSGLIWNSGLQAVSLSLWGRTRSFLVQGTDLQTANGTTNIPLANGPVTSCQGYGFSCCSVESSQGVGDQITVAQDCPRTCYQSCVARPVVLSFSSDPYFDPKTRIVNIKSEQDVFFSYVTDVGSAQPVTVTLEFGDGGFETFNTAEGSVAHTYRCNTPGGCEYVANIKIVNSAGIESVTTTVSQIIIKVL